MRRRETIAERDWMDIFGDNLKDALIEANMTQHELAEAANLSDAAVSSYIHKQKMPSVRAAVNISRSLDWDLTDMLDYGANID